MLLYDSLKAIINGSARVLWRARATGVIADVCRQRRRMTVEQMLAVGDEIAAMPLLDTRSPREIMDGINAV